MTEMENVVKALEEAGIRDNVAIMVGGAPVTQSFCESISADRYAPDAASAADEALAVCAS
jgi:methanogenic corrinoid protein MtbC1